MVAPVDLKILPEVSAKLRWGGGGQGTSYFTTSVVQWKEKAIDVGGPSSIDCIAERLYCKRPIQCLASSKILTSHSLTSRRVWCTPPSLVRGKDIFAGWRGVGGSIFWKTPDTALYSSYVSTLWIFIYFWRSNKKQRSCDGRGGRAAPRLGNELKKTGARSARARTRGQNPLVF
jgi:hypothetical protein